MSDSGNALCRKRLEQWTDYVQQMVRVMEMGRAIPLGHATPPCNAATPSANTRKPAKVLIAAPHPDDEALIGALPLRLRLEADARVVNCAVTLGSNRQQRPRRAMELQSACKVLGFDLIIPQQEGFDKVNLQNRRQQPREWAAKVKALKEIFDKEKPEIVFAPHREDFNSTHIGTHYLVVDALARHLQASGRGPLPLVETEFWHQNSAPNLMVGLTPEMVAIQIMATAEHGGEVSRNPYHLRLPARMIDNVRRGSEVVGGQGGPAAPFVFAELYRVTFMNGTGQVMPRPGGRLLGLDQKASAEWLLSQFQAA